MKPLLDALRFARYWSSARRDLGETEVEVPWGRDNEVVPGTLFSLPGDRPRTGWVVLHGITRPGRKHPELLRFVRGLASTGGRVLIPEIPPWTDLCFEPERALEIIRGAVLHLAESPGVRPGGVVLMGFSFGGPQALLAAADRSLAPRIRGVVSWGGYADLDRVVAFQFTGRHRWTGREESIRPDPYGRWVIGANCLTLTPGYRDRGDTAKALYRLAAEAGERQLPPLDPALDPLRVELREKLPGKERALFDLFAPPWNRDPDPERGADLAGELTTAARARMPLLDPIPRVESVDVPVRLLHGRSDRLIPYTETFRLEQALKPRVRDLKARVTGLFAHSRGSGPAGGIRKVREGLGFLWMLASVFELDR
jgi:pimeloyl-ACP methyl ester carboxylesterase